MNVLPGSLPDGHRSGGVGGVGYPSQGSSRFEVFMFKLLPKFRSTVSCFSLSLSLRPVTESIGMQRQTWSTWTFLTTRSLVAVEPRRLPVTDVGTETTFRLDQHKHLQKINISWGQRSVKTNRSSPASIYMYKWEDRSAGRSTCLASQISVQMEPYSRSEFTPCSIWKYWMLIDRQI